MMTDHNPTNTKLIHIPVFVGDKRFNMCLYINSLKTNGRPGLMLDPFLFLIQQILGWSIFQQNQ